MIHTGPMISIVSNKFAERGANLPKYLGRTRPRKCTDSSVLHGNMHLVRLGTDLFGNTKRQSSTRMSGSARHGRQLVGRPRTPWGIFVVTCNTCQVNTNSEHRFGLPRVSLDNVKRSVRLPYQS